MGDKITNKKLLTCNIDHLERVNDNGISSVYNLDGRAVIKKVIIDTKKKIKELKWEIIVMKKINGDPFFPKLYEIKMCSKSKPPFMLIKMERFDYTMKEWMKSDHSIEEWKDVFKQIFIIIDRLNCKYKISIMDVKPGNLMFKKKELKMIDFGANNLYRRQADYHNMIYLYNNRYGINIYDINIQLLDKGWNKHKAWKYATDYKLAKSLFDDGTLDIDKINKWEYPTKIIPFIKELQKSYGKPAKYFLEKYFQDIE